MSGSADRQQQLDVLERQITNTLHTAGQALQELSKEKPSIKQMETYTQNFTKSLESIESGLSRHINYLMQVATSQPHEGSSYAAAKDLQMAFHRFEHVKSRLQDLERLRTEHRIRQQNIQRQMSGDHLANMQRGGYNMQESVLQRSSFQQSTPMDFQSGT